MSARVATAFVLAGGGSLGAVVVGMLREVLRAGVRPDFVVGSSAGAINAAYFAGRPTQDGVTALEALWCKLTSVRIFGARWRSLIAALRRHEALCTVSCAARLLEAHLTYRDLSESALPVHVIASDLATGEEVVLSSGPAIDAVLASSAIPGFACAHRRVPASAVGRTIHALSLLVARQLVVDLERYATRAQIIVAPPAPR